MNSQMLLFGSLLYIVQLSKINAEHPRYNTIKMFGMESRCLGVVQFHLG